MNDDDICRQPEAIRGLVSDTEAIAGSAIVARAPDAAAGAIGFGIYKLLGGGEKLGRTPSVEHLPPK